MIRICKDMLLSETCPKYLAFLNKLGIRGFLDGVALLWSFAFDFSV